MGMMWFWFVILAIWWVIFFTIFAIAFRSATDTIQLNEHQKTVRNIDALMNANPHVTDETKLVDALKNENIVYRGCAR